MNTPLFAPSPRRKRGLILTLSGSLLFHGSLIGVAAYWPTRPVEEPKSLVSVGWNTPEPAGETLPPADPPRVADFVPPPMLTASEPAIEIPTAIEPNLDDMTLATPVPPVAARSLSHPVPAVPVTRAIHAASNLPAGGPASGVVGGSGVGHPGVGVRWNTPKPAYPAALRLAHVQGSGIVRVTTDGSGGVVSATVVQSTGNARLDEHICRVAKSGWSGPPNSAISVPITYQLQ